MAGGDFLTVDVVTLALANQYTEESLAGAGALKGKDGFSPVIAQKKIPGGTEVSITDSSHTETFEIKDGEGVPPGGTDGQVLTKTGNHAEWKDPKDVSFPDFVQCVL